MTLFQNLDEVKGFWEEDYCWKVLPAKYREKQKEDFGKKGVILHVDRYSAFKGKQRISKKVYFTTLCRCDQGLIDSLCLATIAPIWKKLVPSQIIRLPIMTIST